MTPRRPSGPWCGCACLRLVAAMSTAAAVVVAAAVIYATTDTVVAAAAATCTEVAVAAAALGAQEKNAEGCVACPRCLTGFLGPSIVGATTNHRVAAAKESFLLQRDGNLFQHRAPGAAASSVRRRFEAILTRGDQRLEAPAVEVVPADPRWLLPTPSTPTAAGTGGSMLMETAKKVVKVEQDSPRTQPPSSEAVSAHATVVRAPAHGQDSGPVQHIPDRVAADRPTEGDGRWQGADTYREPLALSSLLLLERPHSHIGVALFMCVLFAVFLPATLCVILATIATEPVQPPPPPQSPSVPQACQPPSQLHMRSPAILPQRQQQGGPLRFKERSVGEADPWSAYPLASDVTCQAAASIANIGAQRTSKSPTRDCRQRDVDEADTVRAIAGVADVDIAPVAEDDSHGGPQRRYLCTRFVVPHGMMFVFAVREVLNQGRQQLSFSIVDISGHPLCHAIVNEVNTKRCGIALQFLTKEPLAYIRTNMLHDQAGGLPVICDADEEPFCELMRDQRFGSARRYLLQDCSGEKLMAFHGNFREKAVNGVAPSGELMCVTRRCTIDADNAPHVPYYEVRVSAHVDVGMLLCGLLAIDKVEGLAGATSEPGTSNSELGRCPAPVAL